MTHKGATWGYVLVFSTQYFCAGISIFSRNLRRQCRQDSVAWPLRYPLLEQALVLLTAASRALNRLRVSRVIFFLGSDPPRKARIGLGGHARHLSHCGTITDDREFMARQRAAAFFFCICASLKHEFAVFQNKPKCKRTGPCSPRGTMRRNGHDHGPRRHSPCPRIPHCNAPFAAL